MKNKSLLLYSTILLSIFLFSFAIQEKVQVKDIVSNPTAFENEEVIVNGLVTQYVESQAKTTAYYLLKGDYGALIRVNTAEGQPKVNWKYKVRGILYIDESNQEPFISEKSKTILEYVPPGSGSELPPPPPEKTWIQQNFILLLIIGGGLILILVLILVFTNRKSKPQEVRSMPKETGLPKQPSGTYQTTQKNELNTMIVPAEAPKTMKFIPGELEVISGADKGKKIKIAGYPTSDGSVITIGRETVTGARDYAHIELKERTISRKQAEIISREGKIYVKNLSSTNYTKLDGVDIPPNSTSELKLNSIITLGEVELKYIK